MNKVLYSFNIYFKNQIGGWSINGSSSTAMHWDTIITVYGSSLEDAIKNLPEEYGDCNIVKVDYPIGYPNFPLFPPSTSTGGVVENSFLRVV